MTFSLPEQDRYGYGRQYMLSTIARALGGRIAEEVFMGEMTTGASSDFQSATNLARRMVTEWGMSDLMGTVVYGENDSEVFLGRSVTTHKNVSESTMQKVDQEIRRIIDEQYAIARGLIEQHADKMHALANGLLEFETLDSEQLDDIMNGLPPRPPKPSQSGSSTPPAAPSTGTGAPAPTATNRPAREA